MRSNGAIDVLKNKVRVKINAVLRFLNDRYIRISLSKTMTKIRGLSLTRNDSKINLSTNKRKSYE